jgi:AcrR family transcriptional regulator
MKRPPSPKTPPATPEPPEAAPEPTRARLLRAALGLFSQQGFARTSTREIAEAAQVNIAAISYHFGDKAGLYKAAFMEPFWEDGWEDCLRASASQPLDVALRALFVSFLEPLRHGDLAHQSIKLRCREMLEPTGLWAQEIEHGITPLHQAIVRALRRHLGLRRSDHEVERLAVCIAGLGVHLQVGHDVIDALAPQLHRMPQAFAHWADRLVMYAMAMVDAEAARRRAKATVGSAAAPAHAPAAPLAARSARPKKSTR